LQAAKNRPKQKLGPIQVGQNTSLAAASTSAKARATAKAMERLKSPKKQRLKSCDGPLLGMRLNGLGV